MVLDTLINTYTASFHSNPSVAVLANGSFVVTWESYGQDGDGPGIYGQRYDASGNRQGAEFRINTYTTNDQSASSVTALTDGGFVVVWNSNQQDASDIYGQRYDAIGNAQGTEFRVNSFTENYQQYPSVAGLSNGNFVVIWKSAEFNDEDIDEMHGQLFDANGNLLGAEFLINSSIASYLFLPSVAALTDGGFVITWQSIDQDGNSHGIYGQRYNLSGNPVGTEFRINSVTTDGTPSVSVAALTDGGFVVTWESSNQDGNGSGIHGQRYNPSGNPAGTEFLVNHSMTFAQDNPTASSLTDGGFVVIWESYEDGVYGQRYDANGLALGEKFRASDRTGSQFEPSITGLTDGSYLMVWVSSSQDGFGIYGKRFDANGNEVEWNASLPPIIDGAAAAAKLEAILAENKKLLEGTEEVDLIQLMADFSKAAYHLQKHENSIINDISDFAKDALDDIKAQGWEPLDLDISLPDGSFSYTKHVPFEVINPQVEVIQTNGMSDGFYTYGNAAAFVARADDAIVISFRGTNDNGDNNPSDPENNIYPDKDDWTSIGGGSLGKVQHYFLLQPLISALDKFVSDSSNGINKVYVTGHSLGGSMATQYMQAHKGNQYAAVTFAAPPYGVLSGFVKDEDRVTHIEISGDPVPDAPGFHPGRTIHFHGKDTPGGTTNHSMDYYRQITKSIDTMGWINILNTPGEPTVLLGARVEEKLKDQNFDTYRVDEKPEDQTYDAFIVDGMESGNNKPVDNGNDELSDRLANEYDFFYGGHGLDKLTGNGDNNFLFGGSGNDTIDGGGGIDTASYSDTRANYTLSFNERFWPLADQLIVADYWTALDSDGTDTLENIERLIFTDSGVAFDINDSGSHAGQVAKMIGAVFGAEYVTNTDFIATGLYYLDNGVSYEDLVAGALSITGAKTPEQVVTLLWTNVVGSPPTTDQMQPFVNDLNLGKYTTGSLGVSAAEHEINQANINLTGLVENGIAFDPSYYQPIG